MSETGTKSRAEPWLNPKAREAVSVTATEDQQTARLKIYPDSAHGFLFQHHDEFAADVHAFLAEAG